MDRKELGKVFNDCVHGHIELPPLCVAIIDTPIFQRLRNIKQLGFAYYVYPGAAHNRFEHSLGVCYLAGLLADELNGKCMEAGAPRVTREEKLCLQVAGLCHDLGHGPFSHTWERVLERVPEREGERELERVKWEHEEMSLKLLEQVFQVDSVKRELDKNGLIEEHTDMIKDMIKGKKDATKSFLYEIISNKDTGIDVDKWDYLLRDGQQLNIRVTFDPYRLLKCQRISSIETQDGQTQYHICYRDKDQANIWHMYMMRAELHRMAYQHPVVKIIEEMFIDTMLLLIKDNYRICGEELAKVHNATEKFVYLTDDIFQDILRIPDRTHLRAQELLLRILNRELYILLARKTLSSDEDSAKSHYRRMEALLQKKKKEFNELNSQELDLHLAVLQWSMPDLRKSVFTYSKSDLKTAKLTEDWSSVPFYKEQVNHTEVLFITKNEESQEEIEKLKTLASEIRNID